MSANKLEFQEGTLVFRNTWKNRNGHIRTNLYATAESAHLSVITSKNLYQEIATPVHASHCLIDPKGY